MSEAYVRNVVLPSVGLPYKPTYTLCEACKIFDCSPATLWRMAKKGEINITRGKRIYIGDIINYFSNCEENGTCK